ncbi:hypothetical protein RJ55_01511 [Drechmeria coniospora]|nr:hypothetical protein RJ55_01511 [Drechmeria coniospora]
MICTDGLLGTIFESEYRTFGNLLLAQVTGFRSDVDKAIGQNRNLEQVLRLLLPHEQTIARELSNGALSSFLVPSLTLVQSVCNTLRAEAAKATTLEAAGTTSIRRECDARADSIARQAAIILDTLHQLLCRVEANKRQLQRWEKLHSSFVVSKIGIMAPSLFGPVAHASHHEEQGKRLAIKLCHALPEVDRRANPSRDSARSSARRQRHLREAVEAYFPATCESSDWILDESDRRPLWCCGVAGTGKSTLGWRVVDALDRSNRIFSSYFLGWRKVQSAERVAASLLWQLCDRANLHNLPSLDSEPGPACLQHLLDALKDVCSTIGQPVHVVLDAWDEDNMDDVDAFDAILRCLLSLKCKLFITSRTSSRRGHSVDCVELNLDLERNEDGIRRCIRQELDHLAQPTCRDHGRSLLDLGEEPVRRLMAETNGSFGNAIILARVVADAFHGGTPIDQLTNLLEKGGPGKIVAQDLRGLDGDASLTGRLARTTLTWLSLTPYPPSLRVLEPVLSAACSDLCDAQPSFSTQHVLHRLRGHVMVDHGNSLIHISDLTRDVMAEVWSGQNQDVVRTMAVLCLDTIERSDIKSVLRPDVTEESMKTLLLEDPLLDHALRCWSFYCREQQRQLPSGLSEHASLEGDDAAAEPSCLAVASDDDADCPVDGAWTMVDTIESRLQQLFCESLVLPVVFASAFFHPVPEEAGLGFRELQSRIASMSNLHLAVRLGSVTLVEAALALSAYSDDIRYGEGLTALHEAARRGFEDVGARLLSAGASSGALDESNRTPVHYAGGSRSHGLFMQLFEDFCRRHYGGKDDRWHRGDYDDPAVNDDILELIIGDLTIRIPRLEAFCRRYRGGKDDISEQAIWDVTEQIPRYVQCVTPNGQPYEAKRDMALLNAVKQGKHKVCHFLLMCGQADANCCDDNSVPALHVAIEHQDIKAMVHLLHFGANPCSTRGEGKTPAVFAAIRWGCYDAIDCLVAYGADQLTVDPQGLNVLMLAVSETQGEDSCEIIELFTRSPNFQYKRQDGRGPVHLAALRGDFDVMRLLFTSRPIPGEELLEMLAPDATGMTPADLAREHGHDKISRYLDDLYNSWSWVLSC